METKLDYRAESRRQSGLSPRDDGGFLGLVFHAYRKTLARSVGVHLLVGNRPRFVRSNVFRLRTLILARIIALPVRFRVGQRDHFRCTEMRPSNQRRR